MKENPKQAGAELHHARHKLGLGSTLVYLYRASQKSYNDSLNILPNTKMC